MDCSIVDRIPMPKDEITINPSYLDQTCMTPNGQTPVEGNFMWEGLRGNLENRRLFSRDTETYVGNVMSPMPMIGLPVSNGLRSFFAILFITPANL